MPSTFNNIQRIFSLKNEQEFNDIALEIFHYQYNQNKIYRSFVQFLGYNADVIKHYRNIPFLPIEFFKTHSITTGKQKPILEFSSSGTTGTHISKHYVIDSDLYKTSFIKGFQAFYGELSEYIILGLLPSYLERKDSSLVFMVDELIRLSNHPLSGFYLDDYEKLNETLLKAAFTGRKILLMGVSYALLDFCELYPQMNPALIIMETGGMKGRRNEMTRNELHGSLKRGFGVDNINSEYGMTEILSQAYSKGEGLFLTPPWMKVLIRDSEDPLHIVDNLKTGGINIIDLANVNSCSFIATQDLGKQYNNGAFEILGRFDSSDIRGCNLMVL